MRDERIVIEMIREGHSPEAIADAISKNIASVQHCNSPTKSPPSTTALSIHCNLDFINFSHTMATICQESGKMMMPALLIFCKHLNFPVL
jgi:hypothetical protein